MILPSAGESAQARAVKLSSVLHQVRNGVAPQSLNGDEHFVGLQNISSSGGRLLSLSSVAEVTSRVNHFEAGDVLFGRLRPGLRKAAVASFPGFASAELLVLRCAEALRPQYLLTVLLSDRFADYVADRTTGDRPRVSYEVIGEYQFDLPGLDEQDEIVSRELVVRDARLEIARAAASALETSREFVQRMRSALIWSPSRAASFCRFADLVESIDYGTSKRSEYGNEGTPVLRIPNVDSDGKLNGENLKYSRFDAAGLARYSVEQNDILIIRSNGSLQLVGRAALVSERFSGFAFAGYLLRVRPRSGVLPHYLMHVIHSLEFRSLVESSARASTGINNLSAGRLAEFRVPALSMMQQRETIEALDRALDSSGEVASNLAVVQGLAGMVHAQARSYWLDGESEYRQQEVLAGIADARSTIAHVPSGRTPGISAVPSMDTARMNDYNSGANAGGRAMITSVKGILSARGAWIDGQELFRVWLNGEKAEPTAVERFYDELMALDREGLTESAAVEDEAGRKVGGRVRWVGRADG